MYGGSQGNVEQEIKEKGMRKENGKKHYITVRMTAVILLFGIIFVPLGAYAGEWKEKHGGKGKTFETEAEEYVETATEEETQEIADLLSGHLPATDSLAREEDTEGTEIEETEKPELPHGTATEVITEDMLNLTPPADYEINPDMQADAKEGKYNAFFLKDDLQTVSIDIDENNLNYMFQNAIDKPTVMTNSVTIGDQTIGYTGIKTKGSYTLEHSVTEGIGSDRFSFTINFGKFIKKKDYGAKQNFYGVSKISFNNFFFDKSMMKEYFALKLMSEMGVPTPQYGIAKVYINGEYYGVYAMIEALDSSILEQYWDVEDDEVSSYLVKPEETSLLEFQIEADESLLWEKDEDTYQDVKDMLPTVKEWLKKLNQLNEGKDFDDKELDVNSEAYVELLNQIMDVDEVVKYFAVHSFLCQMDNYFDGMKNYGLYVGADGRSLIIPWDYDLSFGCYYPCDAESTANYDIDVMYRALEWGTDSGSLAEQSEAFYKNYPLFHVIYQNDTLMEQYHEYMRDCTKVAALGGTIYSGQTYEPGYFNSFVEQLKEPVSEAAGLELADNVYYMNGANQPLDATTASPNLAKIIAMRSVGVLVQLNGTDTTVSGEGCHLSTLGNAIEGFNRDSGNLTAVDAATGIFVTANYTRGVAPALTVKQISKQDEYYEEIRSAIGCSGNDSLVIYSIKNTAEPMDKYTITLPLSSAYREAEGEIAFYSFADGTATELTMSVDDNLYTGDTDTIKYIAIVQKGGNALSESTDEAQSSKPQLLILWKGIAGVLLAAAVAAGVVVVAKKRRKNRR